MDDLCKRVSLIIKNICDELDDQSFVNFKDASREITKTIRNGRFYWIRLMRTYNCYHGDFKDSWAKVVERIPAEFVKEIVMSIVWFSKEL